LTVLSSDEVDAYASAVVRGEVPAGKFHRLACERHQRDRRREGTAEFPYRFDSVRAGLFFKFAEKLSHYKGKWAGEPILLQPYQKFRLGSIFGWVHVASEKRRFRNAYNELPRKNGKSLEAAVVGLYTTFFNGEAGAEGYCAATKRDQAAIVFGDCKKLVQASGLKSRIVVQVGNLHREDTASKLEPLGADHDSTDGLNPNFICLDELHGFKTRGMIDVLETATGARQQPLIFKITTAGDDPVSPGGDEHDYACKVLEGVLTDETYFAFIAHADVDDDWTLPETARKANPNYDVSVNPEDLAAKVAKAQGMPAAAAAYQQKHLNRWVNASAPWLSMDGWRKGQSTWDPSELEHEPCFVGVDLSSKLDLTALVAVFPPTPGRAKWRLLPYIWTPEETMIERGRRDRAPYDIWIRLEHLLTTPGTRIDHMVIRDKLKWLRTRYDVQTIGFDPWHADQLIGQLVSEDGFSPEQVLEVRQTYAAMSSACSRLEAEILDGAVDAGGNPVMAWCASNAIVQRDGKDNIYPVKKKSRGRIDPIMATIIGMAMWLKRPETETPQYQILAFGG
jgi:phage terminase large subunit-like protein